ncbi:AAA family ATPase [Parendozoicomonas sp. Alg238-R29]|uniref:AAA family ATPase n=1 Tax=Parendozoicomonas sp. Alg238-R29 TaxID=2993446 RepID=UPI00248E2EDF|nr:AAA family ATPase [Parendozoicomonas sp. Alg238-R29]
MNTMDSCSGDSYSGDSCSGRLVARKRPLSVDDSRQGGLHADKNTSHFCRAKRRNSEPGKLDQPRIATRAVSLLPNPQVNVDPSVNSARSFDFRFVSSDQNVLDILDDLTEKNESQEVVLMTHPDGLQRDNLTRRLTLAETGKHNTREGRLFRDQKPLTLVLDIRNMSAKELTQFNDLLDPESPCLYDKQTKKKRTLGSHISILVLAASEQLTATGTNDTQTPGADFWRRVNRSTNTWQLTETVSADEPMDVTSDHWLPEYSSSKGADSTIDSAITVDLHIHPDWRSQLFGRVGVDKAGKICHIPGVLEQLKPGQGVILKGADWSDLELQHQIRQLQHGKRYYSNGNPRLLPDDIVFFQADVTESEVHELRQSSMKLVTSPPDHPVIINKVNLCQWLNPITINQDGVSVPNTALLNQISSGAAITITSPLSESQWFMLLGHLRDIKKETGKSPEIFLAHAKNQPDWIQPPVDSECEKGRLPTNLHAKVITYDCETQFSEWREQQSSEPLVIQINAQTRPGQLFDNLHVLSEQTPRFGRSTTQLQRALQTGLPVVFLGLESNPEMQQVLESLLCQPSSVIINGSLLAFPHSNIHFFWPSTEKSCSTLFTEVIQRAEKCTDIDIWNSTAARHSLSRDLLPKKELEAIYEAYKELPTNLEKHPGKLPTLSSSLLDNLIIAARHAQKVDGDKDLQPAHWRKAINSVLTHSARHNPRVRDFLKVICERLLPDADHKNWVDRERLADMLNSTTHVNRAFIHKNFWSLARAFGPGAFKNLQLRFDHPNPMGSDSDVVDRMAALLIKYGPEEWRHSLVSTLRPKKELVSNRPKLSNHSSRRLKRLEDALASGWEFSEKGLCRTQQITTLARECYAIANNTALDNNQQRELIRVELNKSLAWKRHSKAPLDELTDDLLLGKTDQSDRERRRLSRLKDRLSESPVVFIQGETGTGKSYFAAKMAQAAGASKVMSIGPSTDDSELVQRWVWQDNQDETDRSMVRLNQVLLQWIQSTPETEDSYVTLIMDEANLAQNGLLDTLRGLWDTPPRIFADGQPVPVSSRHRVILTGNPDSYAGRHMSSALQEKMQRVYYPALDKSFLQDRVVEPALYQYLRAHCTDETTAQQITQQATQGVLALWQHYQKLLPEHEFTPRDLTDICAWVGWYLDQSASSIQELSSQELSSESVHALVLQSFRDVFGHEAQEQAQEPIHVIEHWFSHHFPVNHTILAKVQSHTLQLTRNWFTFETHQKWPDFDTSSAAVSNLAEALLQDLSRTQHAFQCNRKHGGRQATLVEGPTGRGKDATLRLAIQSFQAHMASEKQPMPVIHYLNACDCSWGTLRSHIQKAKINGEILVISEMNLIDSQHLEGELNDILAGDAHPGFHLFATTNPPHYAARKPLSPALKGRFRHLPIREYRQNELTSIAVRLLPETQAGKTWAEQMTDYHCRLRHHLQEKNIAVQPTSLDLQNLARAVATQSSSSPAEIKKLFEQHYRLYLLAARLTVDTLPPLSPHGIATAPLDLPLCKWLNTTLSPLDHPWLIKRGGVNAIHTKNHEITLQAGLEESEAHHQVIKLVAEVRWQSSGMSIQAPDNEDTLVQSFYVLWQRHWFQHNFPHFNNADIDKYFPSTRAQSLTLNLAANQRYLAQIETFLKTADHTKPQLQAGNWAQIKDILKHPVSHYSAVEPKEQDEIKSSKTAPALDTQAVLPSATPKILDNDTDYDSQSVLPTHEYRTFNCFRDPGMYRLRVFDLAAIPKGRLITTRQGRGEYGLEVVLPGVIPEQGTLSLANNQTYGITTLPHLQERWLYLPSLTAGETIRAVKLIPGKNFSLMRDRYTGLHMIHVPDATPEENVAIHYVVETPNTEKNNHRCGGQHQTLFTTGEPIRPDATCPPEISKEIENLFSSKCLQTLPEDQQMLLSDIKEAHDPETRISHISMYCMCFCGESKTKDTNLLRFLLQERQGACRHRTPIFVALCRYFGIPARIISSASHTYPEYSLDNGATWKSEDLGGSPSKIIKHENNFPTGKKGISLAAGSQKLNDTLRGMNPQEMAAMAQALGITSEEVVSSAHSGLALPASQTFLTRAEVIEKLWEQGSESGFSLGCRFLKDLDKLDFHERNLLGCCTTKSKQLADAVIYALEKSVPPCIITKELKELHHTYVVDDQVSSSHWQHTIQEMFEGIKDRFGIESHQMLVIAQVALENNWLSPADENSTSYLPLLALLNQLHSINILRPFVQKNLLNWYIHCQTKQIDILNKNKFLPDPNHGRSNNLLKMVTGSHGGYSPTLESALKSDDLLPAWTDEPEGIPDIERLLTSHSAFPLCRSGKKKCRSVIMVECPEWGKTNIKQKTSGLLLRCANSELTLKAPLAKANGTTEDQRQRNSIENPLAENSYEYWQLRDSCSTAIKHAFAHYLYQATDCKGGNLTIVLNSALYESIGNNKYFGSVKPRSPSETLSSLNHLVNNRARDCLDSSLIKKAFKNENALILKREDLNVIFNEFLERLDIESLYQEDGDRIKGVINP